MQWWLVHYRFLPRGNVNDVFGYRTEEAVIAFQGWWRLSRDGVAGPLTLHKIVASASHTPYPWSRAAKHVEIHKARGVLLEVGASGECCARSTSPPAGPVT